MNPKNKPLSNFQKGLAYELLNHLLNTKKKTCNYREIASKIPPAKYRSGMCLGIPAYYVSCACVRNGQLPLTAILCAKKTGYPGKGFDEMYESFFSSDEETITETVKKLHFQKIPPNDDEMRKKVH